MRSIEPCWGPSSLIFKSREFVFFFLFGLGFFFLLSRASPAATARQKRAPPRSILPPTRPGGGAGRSGLNHFPGGGGEGCVSACKGGGRPLLFPAGPPLRTCPRGAARGEAERAVSLSAGGRCEGAEREGGSVPSVLPHRSPQLPVPHRPALPPEDTPPCLSARGALTAALPAGRASFRRCSPGLAAAVPRAGLSEGVGGAQSPSGPRRGDSAE